MTRSEMIAYVQKAEGVPAQMKAAAVMGIALMSKNDLARFSGLADRGLSMVQSGDYVGIMTLLEEVDAPPDVIEVAKTFLGSLPTSGIGPDSTPL